MVSFTEICCHCSPFVSHHREELKKRTLLETAHTLPLYLWRGPSISHWDPWEFFMIPPTKKSSPPWRGMEKVASSGELQMKLMQKPRGNTLLLRRLSIARDLFEEILLMSKKGCRDLYTCKTMQYLFLWSCKCFRLQKLIMLNMKAVDDLLGVLEKIVSEQWHSDFSNFYCK